MQFLKQGLYTPTFFCNQIPYLLSLYLSSSFKPASWSWHWRHQQIYFLVEIIWIKVAKENLSSTLLTIPFQILHMNVPQWTGLFMPLECQSPNVQKMSCVVGLPAFPWKNHFIWMMILLVVKQVYNIEIFWSEQIKWNYLQQILFNNDTTELFVF
jgi:hypothetical protein